MLQFLMEDILLEAVRAVGVVFLKAVTLGRYTSDRPTDWATEGFIGLAIIGAATWMVIRWL
jgi:hypothetical protein